MSATVNSKRRVEFVRITMLLLVAMTAFATRGPAIAQEPPAASFDSINQDNPPTLGDEPQRGGNSEEAAPTLSFSFRFAPWEDVLTKFADVAGLTLDLTDVPPGTFNYYDKGRYSPREALDILNGYLLQRGFALVRRDRFLVCVNLEKGLPANLIPIVPVEQLADYGNHELASVIFAHDDLDATFAAGQIEQLQGPHGKAIALNGTNSLLVTDTAGNLRLIQRLLDKRAFVRRPPSDVTGPAFKSFTLQHVRATEAERLIRTLFAQPTAGSEKPNSAELSITTDARTNRLFVSATTGKLAAIEQLVLAYDVVGTSLEHSPSHSAPTTRVLPLPNADVIIIGRALASLSPRIHVRSTLDNRRSVALESPPEQAAPDEPVRASSAGAILPAPAPRSPDGRDR